jgi:hypothetical protein
MVTVAPKAELAKLYETNLRAYSVAMADASGGFVHTERYPTYYDSIKKQKEDAARANV